MRKAVVRHAELDRRDQHVAALIDEPFNQHPNLLWRSESVAVEEKNEPTF